MNTVGGSAVVVRDGYLEADRADGSVRFIAFAFVLIPTLAGTARGLIVPGFRISEVLAVALVGIMVLRLHRRMMIGGAVFWALVAYAGTVAAICAYHIMVSSSLYSSDFINYGLGPTILLLIYLGAFAAGGLPGILTLTVKYLLVLSAAMGLVGLLQAFGVHFARALGSAMTNNMSILNPISWKVPRSVGIFNSWHAYAGYMALCLIIAGACLSRNVKLFKHPASMLVVTACIGGGLLSSLTFGTIAFGFIGFAFFVLRSRQRFALLPAALFVLVVVKFSPVSDYLDRRVEMQETSTVSSGILPQTIQFRLNVWMRDYLPLVQENLLIGYGPVRSTDRVFSYFESMYIYLLVIAGVPALLLFLVLMWALISSLRKAGRSFSMSGESLGASVCGALGFAILGLMVLMFIHPYMNDAGASQLLMMLSGLAIGKYVNARSSGEDTASETASARRLEPAL
ncbi:hypothetical protein B2J88_29330 [Rhodococcus sp. SRB_17]|nr:hypothetical protein [Rhodococcus sp. SRB_17]